MFFGDLNKCKNVVPLFGAAYAAPNKGTTILYYINSLKLIFLVMDSSISEVEFLRVNQYFSKVFSP